MWPIFVIEGLFVIGIVFYLTKKYASYKRTPWYAYWLTIAIWFAALSVIFLVPADVVEALRFETTGTTDDPSLVVLTVFWATCYWTAYVATWIIIPFMQTYIDSGGFNRCDKIKDSMKENLLFYLIAGILGGIFLTIIAVTQHLDGRGVMGFAIALANAYGLFLLILLMGHGLVELPREFWRRSRLEVQLRAKYFAAAKLMEEMEEVKDDNVLLMDELRRCDRAIAQTDSELRPLMDIILDKMPLTEEHHAYGRRRTTDTEEKEQTVTRKDLIRLHAQVKETLASIRRTEHFWEDLCDKTFEWEDMLSERDGTVSTDHITWVHTRRQQATSKWGRFKERVSYIWKIRLGPVVYRVVSIFMMLLSLAVVWSECVLPVTSPMLGVFGYWVRLPDSPLGFTQFLVVIPVLYMILSAQNALFKLKVFKLYRLFSHQHTDPSSLLFSAAYLGRLTAPLAFNFLTMAHLLNDHTAYENVVGAMDLVPVLGNGFQLYYPIVLVVFCAFTLFNVLTRIVNYFKCCHRFRRFTFDAGYKDENVETGRQLLHQARKRREQRLALRESRRIRHTEQEGLVAAAAAEYSADMHPSATGTTTTTTASTSAGYDDESEVDDLVVRRMFGGIGGLSSHQLERFKSSTNSNYGGGSHSSSSTGYRRTAPAIRSETEVVVEHVPSTRLTPSKPTQSTSSSFFTRSSPAKSSSTAGPSGSTPDRASSRSATASAVASKWLNRS